MENNLSVFYDDNFIVKMKTTLLFKNSNTPNLYNAHLFFRYYVAKCYLNNENVDYAFKLYNEMQQKRVAFKPQIPKEKAFNEQAFKNLINSIKNNGFSDNFPISINKKLKLFDGSHRLAIALLLNIDYVPVKIMEKYEDIDACYDVNWFYEQGLTEHIEIINKTKQEIENKFNICFEN